MWLQAGAWSNPHRFISFYFDATVTVDRISLAYGPADLLVEVGKGIDLGKPQKNRSSRPPPPNKKPLNKICFILDWELNLKSVL